MTKVSALSFLVTQSSENPLSYYRDSTNSKRQKNKNLSYSFTKNPPHILLIDDDQVLCRILEKIAGKNHIQLTAISSMDEIQRLKEEQFDVALVDYNLGLLSGYELVSYLERMHRSLPVVLISATKNLTPQNWPVSIKEFVNKALGPYAVLDAALEIVDRARNFEEEVNNKKPQYVYKYQR